MPTFNEFINAVIVHGYPYPTIEDYETFVTSALSKGSISSKEEAAMFLAQILHESDGLKARREYACVETGCPGKYETPDCDAPNQRYFGRGYIQLTWCWNYKPASLFLFNDTRLVEDPDSVARETSIAWDTAFWYWAEFVHTAEGVTKGKFGVTTMAINRGECTGTNHDVAKKRYRMYLKVRHAFNIHGPGDERGCYNITIHHVSV